MGSLTTYFILAYFAHTAARIASDLIPTRSKRQEALVREWLSSGFGIALAYSAGADLLADLGISMLWPPAGLITTGILMGQGLKFGVELLRTLPTTKSGR